VGNDVPAGGRWVEVPPERLPGWVDGFASRHSGVAVAPGPGTTGGPAGPDGLGEGPVAGVTGEPGPGGLSTDGSEIVFLGTDGAVALCQVPFPPLAAALEAGAGEALARRAGELIAEHALADRTVAVLLVRLGGYAAGVFTGPGPRLAASKVGARLVHGRSAAGGTSQHRFARRREKQAAEALGAAADTAAAVFGPFAGRIDAVVLGGDRRAVAGLRDDPRLRPYFALAVDRFLTVPDPRLTVLRASPRQFRAARIRLTGPA
jgi:Actinobacteria/chloroflexi VLRF1 release factor